MRIIILKVDNVYANIVEEVYLDDDDDITLKAKYLTDRYVRLILEQ